MLNDHLNTTYYTESCYVATAAGTQAKVGTLSNYALQKGHLQVAIYNANTYAGAITLNVNGTGAKPIYINGSASSASNYTLPKGMYLVYYDGTNYYFRTDGKITGDITGKASNVTGTVAVGNGGTGQTTAKNAANALINALDTGSSTPVDADYYVSQYVGGGTTTTTFHRRPVSALWSYINGKISGTSPISYSSGAISHANSGVTAASKGDTSNQTPAFGGTFKVPSGTVNATGHLTAFADHTVKIPETEASSTAHGLMSSADKVKLDGIFDLFYPIGSYYETSLASAIPSGSSTPNATDLANLGVTWFNPQYAWGGTWELEASGNVHVSSGTGYTLGATGGSPYIQAHTHTAESNYYIVSVKKTPDNGISRRSIKPGTGTALTNNLYCDSNIERRSSTGAVSGATTGSAGNMPPYIVVNRWHRTA